MTLTTALVIEGGGLRGAFAAGVAAELVAGGLAFDDVVGVSSGAPPAAYIATGQAADLGAFIDGVVGTLYMLAAEDDDVLRILDCFSEGLVDRRDIVRATKMATTTYHNARRRLLAIIERLPANLRDEAVHVMA